MDRSAASIQPPMRRGWRWSITDKTQKIIAEDEFKEEVPMMTKSVTDQPMASVGMSVSVGASKPYGAAKLEVSAWCTLPTLPDEQSILDAYEAAAAYVNDQAEIRFTEAEERHFGKGGMSR